MASAQFSGRYILITGLASLIAGAGSMAMGEWLSAQSSRELYQRRIDAEREEIATIPEQEEGSLLLVAIVVDWLHVLAAGGWLGSLLVLLVAGIPAAYGLGPARRGAAVRNLVRAFSPTALFFTGLLVLSGVASVLIHSNSLAELLGSRYGLLLLAKLAVFLLAMAIGAYNLLRVQPVLGDDTDTTRLRHSVRFELAVGAVVLLITSLLVATALPGADAPLTGSGSAVEAVRVVR